MQDELQQIEVRACLCNFKLQLDPAKLVRPVCFGLNTLLELHLRSDRISKKQTKKIAIGALRNEQRTNRSVVEDYAQA